MDARTRLETLTAEEAAARRDRESAQRARDTVMRQALAAGASKAAIVRATGLNRQYVDRVLGGGSAPASATALEDLGALADRVRVATEREHQVAEARHVAVAQAMDAGALGATEVAQVCRISRGRVYQSRDRGRRLAGQS